MKLKKIKPSKDETYRVGLDDRCLVVETAKNSDVIWLSKSMCKWIADNYKTILKGGDR